MSSYTGLYVQRLKDGKIDSVQVVDPFGNSLSLEPETYIERQINPAINELPDTGNYSAALPQPELSPVIIALADWVKGGEISKEAFYRMQQFSFILQDIDGDFKLTPYGEQILRENGLV